MVASSQRQDRLLAGLFCTVSACAAFAGFSSFFHAPEGGQTRQTVRLAERHQVVLAGFSLPQSLPRLDGPSFSAIAAPVLDQTMIIPPRSHSITIPVQSAVPQADLLTGDRLGIKSAERWRDNPWSDPVIDSDLRLTTDSREVRLAALTMPGLGLSDAPPSAEALASIEQTYVEIRGMSTMASAGAGVGAQSIPLSEEPFSVLSGVAKGFDPAPNPGLHMGAPPSEALASANPDVPADASPALVLALQGEESAKQKKCLADAVYWEARSEPRNGQIAVAQVVVNRALSGFYPKDLCGVVYQNAHRYLSCQFTFACEGRRSLIPTETEYWQKAQDIAEDMLNGKIWLKEVGNATHYHADYVRPWWARKMNKINTIGAHSFYRPRNWS